MSSKDDKNILIHEDEKHLVLDHDYDGIQELNNPLPKWWEILFYVGIIWGLGYIAYLELFGGTSIKQKFEKDYAKVLVLQEEFKKQHSAFNMDKYTNFNNPQEVVAGKLVYEENCLSCHLEDGKGDVGPNLTDAYWLVAKGDPESVYSIIFNGSEENGMPIWSELLSVEDIYRVTAYVMSLKNTNVKGGKDPQGELVSHE